MKKLYCIVLLLATNFAFAQVTVQGVVKDTLNNPLELANVIAINKSTSTLESYSITDKLGKYKLALKKILPIKFR